MQQTTSPETQSAGRHLDRTAAIPAAAEAPTPTDPVDRTLARRAALRDRHAHKLAALMEQRGDLRGVHPLADFVDDAIRWTA